MTEKEQYIRFCEQRDDLPLFLQAWWMECVAGSKKWNVLLHKNSGGEIDAFLPYLSIQKYGFKLILQPNLSQTNGVWIDSSADTEKEKITEFFIEKLSELKVDWYLQNYTFDFPCTSIFEQHGYSVSQRHTFVIPNLTEDEQSLLQSIDSAQRRQIRKAERNGLTINEGTDIETFVHFHTMCLRIRNRENHNLQSVERFLIQEALRRGQGALLYAKDLNGEPLAALFLVWDKTCAYYLIPAYDYQQKNSGASSYLVWQAVLYAKKKGLLCFDFEGGNDASIGRFYRQFGSSEQSYPLIEKTSSWIIRLYKHFRR